MYEEFFSVWSILVLVALFFITGSLWFLLYYYRDFFALPDLLAGIIATAITSLYHFTKGTPNTSHKKWAITTLLIHTAFVLTLHISCVLPILVETKSSSTTTAPTVTTARSQRTCIVYNDAEGHDQVNLRSGPSLSSSRLNTYRNGTKVILIGNELVKRDGFSWIKVQVTSDRLIGWMVATKIKC